MKDKTIAPDLPLLSPSTDENPGNLNSTRVVDSPVIDSTPVIDDLDIPIATRKGVRSCTQHPISKFVLYSRLSPSHKAFVSNLASVSMPNHVQDALTDPK